MRLLGSHSSYIGAFAYGVSHIKTQAVVKLWTEQLQGSMHSLGLHTHSLAVQLRFAPCQQTVHILGCQGELDLSGRQAGTA